MSDIRDGTHASCADKPRTQSFLRIFEEYLSRYQAELATSKCIDFHDMINQASDHLETGRWKSPYERIVVDEFQDLAQDRYRLLRALLSYNESRFLCVGDDWQSIYRFAGSDVTLMTEFESNFGWGLTIPLDRTFRFNDRLARLSSEFVQRNPIQLQKTITTTQQANTQVVHINLMEPLSTKKAAQPREAASATERDSLKKIFESLSASVDDGNTTSVLMLGRYNHLLQDQLKLASKYSKLKVEFSTVHSAKGREADVVILLGAVSGRFGFPTEVPDDPLLQLTLSSPDSFPHAEERRLFYVALTRARKEVHILTRASSYSEFVEELCDPVFSDIVKAPDFFTQKILCPNCQGIMIMRSGSHFSAFWGCSNYPYCEGTTHVCHVCQKGALVKRGGSFFCSEESCSGNADLCPSCHEGMLVKRYRRKDHKPFWGCSKWKADKSGCTYTEKVRYN